MTSVLVVDDRAIDRELLTTVLGYAGYSVHEAATGAEALALMRAHPPDLIISDILMPTMDGYQLVRELRRDPVGVQIPMIFYTATYGTEEVRQLAEACGVSHILVKPAEPEEIIRIAAAAIEGGSQVPSPLPPEEFHREHLQVLNAKLLQQVRELEDSKRQAAESLSLLESLYSTAPVGIGFVDRDFRMARLNDTLAAMNGPPLEEQIGRTVAEVVPGLWPQLEPIYRHVLTTGEEVVNQEMSGRPPSALEETRYWLASYYPVRLDSEIIGVGLVVVDLTERRQAEEFRSVVMDTMAEGLFVLDGEGCFTFLNAAASKMLGWTGDEVRGTSAHSVIHFRHGDGSPSDAFTRKDGTVLPVAYSAAPLSGDSDVPGAVVVFRDVTEEQAERTRVQQELDSLTWVGRTREAIDEGRLVLYAQPIVLLAGGDMREELLIRMIGRDGELIPPGDFLPAAEKYGLIREIDQWVVTQAIQRAANGRSVTANLSGESVGSGELLAMVERQLEETGADPGKLIFEITETALMGDIDAGRMFARGLVQLGCGIALDDFGTGFGSFTYLKELPVRYLKIDIEFVRHLASNPANQHLVKAIVSLAQGFGHQTIAEGVEDEETLALLRDYGVDYAQGFHIGRPAPIKRSANAASS